MGKLVRLELFNFKSYRNHHILQLGDSYFTSIIGPNGSGKSNSMDAISFVLGIKASHLRSNKLHDLVYRGRVLKTATINADGTATDAPVNGQTNGHAAEGEDGASDEEIVDSQASSQRTDPQTAWVMAVYEDDAGEEQRWKRTVTTSGTSEYRINNRIVSSKQYNEALEAENILIKARNFLVFQGDVEAIAQQQPKDLTRLVEQISGSDEYRKDYDDLKQKTEQAAEDQLYKLNQRRGLNGEIKQYQEQKKEAENYARKLDERDQAVINHVLWKLHQFQRVIEDSEAEIQKHQEELKEHRRGVAKYAQRLDQAKQDESKVGKDVSKVERGIKRKEKEIEEKEATLVPIDEKISVTSRNREAYRARVADIAKERDSQSRNVEHLEKGLATVQKAQARWEKDWQQTAQQGGRQLTDADLQEYIRLKGEVTKRTATDQNQVEHLTRQVNTVEEAVNNLKSKVDGSHSKVQRLTTEMDELKERCDAVNTQIKQTQNEVDTKKKEFNGLQSERLKVAQRQTELNEKLHDVLSKIRDMEGGKRQNDKEARTRENVAAFKRHYGNHVRGRVSDLCKPKQIKYNVAVNALLGREADAVVVDTAKTAEDCIQYLKQKRFGTMTFIPLDTIQVKGINPNLRGMDRGMRLAIDTIEYDPALERAMSSVCGDAMICDDDNTARHLRYDKKIDVKAVTLEGRVHSRGGNITGGRGPNAHHNARRWEDADLDNALRLKDKLEADLSSLPKGHRRGNEEETLQGELTGLDQRLRFAQDELKALDRNLSSKKAELGHAQAQLKETRPKYQEQSRQLEKLRADRDAVQKNVGTVEDEVFRAFCQRLGYDNIRAYDAQQGTLQEEARRKKLEFQQQRSKLENQLKFETERLQKTKDRVKRIEDEASRNEEQIATWESEKETIGEELDVLNDELQQMKEQLEALKEQYNERTEKVSEARREVQKRNKNVEQTEKRVEEAAANVQRNASSRYALLRECKIKETKLPLARGSRKLDSLPLDDVVAAESMAMDVDGEDTTIRDAEVNDYGIEIDFEQLDDDLKEDSSDACESTLLEAISNLNSTLEKMAPNMRASDRLENVESRLKDTETDFNAARRAAKRAKDDFEAVKEKRLELFNKAFAHISEQIGTVYKDLTKTAAFPLGGQAYLDTEDSEEPYLAGLKYHAMPPLKRFRDMEHLSGGEKTMAALALLFAVHSFQPSPFFVLDEVDAALDNVNVERVREYVKKHSGPGMQFVVISLKTGFFEGSDTLVGVMRDQARNSSRALSLDLRKYR